MTARNNARAITFPGQGSQQVGMGAALAAWHPAARAVLDEVDDALGEKLSALMADGPEDQLTLTRNAQPALMAVSMAVMRAVEAEAGHPLPALAGYVAGHSLGEYSALAAAGALSIGDAARLLRLRGEAMQTAVPVGVGAMAAMLGLDPEAVGEIAVAASEAGVCDLANDNGPGQVVVSGDKAAVERAVAIAAERGVRKCIMLPVSAPFHCRLMQPAADAMREALAATRLSAPAVPVVANVTAQPTSDPAEIRDLLVRQVTGMVRWRECVVWMAAAGVTEVVEAGSGRVLSGLARRIDRGLTVRTLGAPEEIQAFAAELAAAG